MKFPTNSTFVRTSAAVGITILAVACSTADTTTPVNAAQSAQSGEKSTDKTTITGSRLPAKQTERMVTGTDGRDMERYRPPNPGKGG